MTLVHRAVAVLTAAIILGALVAAALVSSGVVDDASAQAKFRITPSKIKQIQKVSVAAVKRSNANAKGLASLKASTAADIAAIKAQLGTPLPAATGALAAGQTVRGAYNTGGTAAGAGDLANTAMSFVFALAQPPTVRIVQDNAVPPAQCPGTVAVPQAAPGNLCIFAEETFNVSPAGLQLNDVPNGVTRGGATVFVESAAAGNFYSFGTWAVTAP